MVVALGTISGAGRVADEVRPCSSVAGTAFFTVTSGWPSIRSDYLAVEVGRGRACPCGPVCPSTSRTNRPLLVFEALGSSTAKLSAHGAPFAADEVRHENT